ncbi:hypothetical protein HDU98_004165, partial [Podochytrium sp. JEL0797]
HLGGKRSIADRLDRKYPNPSGPIEAPTEAAMRQWFYATGDFIKLLVTKRGDDANSEAFYGMSNLPPIAKLFLQLAASLPGHSSHGGISLSRSLTPASNMHASHHQAQQVQEVSRRHVQAGQLLREKTALQFRSGNCPSSTAKCRFAHYCVICSNKNRPELQHHTAWDAHPETRITSEGAASQAQPLTILVLSSANTLPFDAMCSDKECGINESLAFPKWSRKSIYSPEITPTHHAAFQSLNCPSLPLLHVGNSRFDRIDALYNKLGIFKIVTPVGLIDSVIHGFTHGFYFRVWIRRSGSSVSSTQKNHKTHLTADHRAPRHSRLMDWRSRQGPLVVVGTTHVLLKPWISPLYTTMRKANSITHRLLKQSIHVTLSLKFIHSFLTVARVERLFRIKAWGLKDTDFVFYADASLFGIGIWFPQLTADFYYGRDDHEFQVDGTPMHIGLVELFAQAVAIYLKAILQSVKLLKAKAGLSTRVHYFPGKHNTVADGTTPRYDQKLHRRMIAGVGAVYSAQANANPFPGDSPRDSPHDVRLLKFITVHGFFCIHRLAELADPDVPRDTPPNMHLKLSKVRAKTPAILLTKRYVAADRMGKAEMCTCMTELGGFDTLRVARVYLRSRTLLGSLLRANDPDYLLLKSNGTVPTLSWVLTRFRAILGNAAPRYQESPRWWRDVLRSARPSLKVQHGAQPLVLRVFIALQQALATA